MMSVTEASVAPSCPKKSIRMLCVALEVLPIAMSVDQLPPVATAVKTSEVLPPIETVVGAGEVPVVTGGLNDAVGGVTGGSPMPNPGLGDVAIGGTNGWTGTAVGGDRLLSGIDAKFPSRKFKATIATGISDDTVSKRGAENSTGCVVKNSFRNFENCPRGPSWMVAFTTTAPFESVNIRLTAPIPNDGFATAIAVVLCSIGPIGTSMEPLVTRVDGATIACSTPKLPALVSVSVATTPAIFPESKVATAKPDRTVVSCGKASGQWAKAQARKRTLKYLRTNSPRN